MVKKETKRGPGRPRVEVKQHTPMRSIRVSDADWQAIQERAAAAGLSVSEFMRRRALGQKLA